jgi:dGTPase
MAFLSIMEHGDCALRWLRGKNGVRQSQSGKLMAGFEIGLGYQPRAAFACDPAKSRGRLFAQAPSATRTDFQRDRDRIIHSTAFRRLKLKTQVFVSDEGDHYRTRLTHTIEVSQIARAIARAFRLDEDMAEAIALAHDLGHTPFGHAGERALDRKMREFGGFDHNAQSLRIVTSLERRYADFDGLNLTWETLEGLVKHNGPLSKSGVAVPETIMDFDRIFPLELSSHASLEAQAAAIADDIAYDAHDLDDGLRAGLLQLDQLKDAPLIGELLAEVRESHPGLDRQRQIGEVVRRQITVMVEDVVSATAERLQVVDLRSPEAVRSAGRTLVGFSAYMQEKEAALKTWLYASLYRHQSIMQKMAHAETVVETLFDAYMKSPGEMSEDWRESAAQMDPPRLARHVSDYISGMTDNYALAEHARLFDRLPELG